MIELKNKKIFDMQKFYKYLILLVFVFSSQFAFSQVNFRKERSKGINGGSIGMIAVDPRNNTIYASTGGGVLRSTDNGKNWTLHSSGLTNVSIKALAVDSSGNVFSWSRLKNELWGNAGNRGQCWTL